jgi:hypothetical protein
MMISFLSADLHCPGAQRRQLFHCSNFLVGLLQKRAISVPFHSLFDGLGVSFDLKASGLGSVSVRNTATRVAELCIDLQEVLDKGSVSAKQAQRLRGRMQFAEAQMFGRTGRRCLKVLGEFSEGRQQLLRAKDSFFLGLFIRLLQSNIPREVRALGNDNVVIFTDACYERENNLWPCGLGGVICFGGQTQFFSLPVGKLGRTALGEDFKKQIIFEAETLAAVLAFDLWKEFFANKRCLIFVDNETMRGLNSPYSKAFQTMARWTHCQASLQR